MTCEAHPQRKPEMTVLLVLAQLHLDYDEYISNLFSIANESFFKPIIITLTPIRAPLYFYFSITAKA